MELNIMGIGKEMIDMEQELKSGKTEQSMKDCGRITKLMEKVPSGMCMVMYTKEIGKEIKLMVKENTHI